MEPHEIKEQSANSHADQIDEESSPPSSIQLGTSTGRFSTASLPTGAQNRNHTQKLNGNTSDFSGSNISKSSRFQLQSVPQLSQNGKPINNKVVPNLPLVPNESKIILPAKVSLSVKSDPLLSPILRSTGPLQVQRHGNRLEAGIRFGSDYRLVQTLGNGQCGETWLAEEIKTDNLVVLKPIPLPLQNDDDAIKHVFKSFRRVSLLRSHGICPIFRLGQDETLGYFMVSAFADALTLNDYYEQYCHSFLDFPISAAVALLRPIASALDFAHARKITHRMLKPQNILIGKRSGVVVTDFEITEVIRHETLRQNFPSETASAAHWQAPEIWLDRQYTPRSDQFSLGVLAYQLITGELPFQGEDERELQNSILSDEPVFENSLSGHIQLTIRKILAKNPENRFPSCSAFVTELTKTPEFRISVQTRSPDFWSIKDFETSLDPQCDSRQVRSFPYMNKPKGYSGFSLGKRTILSLTSVVLLAVIIGAGITFGVFDSFPPNQIFESIMNSADQKQIPAKTDTVTNSTADLAIETASPDLPQPASIIGSSRWSQNVEPIASSEFDLFVRSAAEGDVTAQRRLGEIYFYGKGVKPNYAKAVSYLRLAAEQKDIPSTYLIGRCCELGLGGLKRDTARAIEIYKVAAENNFVPAIAALRRLKVEGY